MLGNETKRAVIGSWKLQEKSESDDDDDHEADLQESYKEAMALFAEADKQNIEASEDRKRCREF